MVEITATSAFTEKTAVAMGIFDGVHCGHRLIISAAENYIAKGLAPAVFTFKTESLKFKHGKPFEYIYTDEQKLNILGKLGIKYIMSPDFEDFKDFSGEEFVEKVLCKCMNVSAVVCGENFRFGKNAVCCAEDLKKLGEKYGFEVKVIKLSENSFSSEKYRAMLKDGNVNELYTLGCGKYSIFGKVVEGNRIGRTINFPTINQIFGDGQLVPRRGVYHTITEIDGKSFNSVTNIGVKPTVEKNIKPLAETHILDFNGDLYGKKIEVFFECFIREEKKFNSLEELRLQINSDIEFVRKKAKSDLALKP